MNKAVLAFIAIFIAALAVLWISLSAPASRAVASSPSGSAIQTGFQAGEQAPDFELRSLDGRSVKLSGLRGKPVFLNFWATWCAPCRVEMPWLVELDQQYRAQGVQIVGVSLDDAGAQRDVAAFAHDRGVKYEVLLGNPSVANAYGGVRFMPQSFLIDRDGKIVRTVIGLTDKKDLEDGVKALLTGRAEFVRLTSEGR